jgi:uncharacterized protein (DUF427 family)
MPIARWNGVTIAEASTDQVEIVEGNVYFPAASVDQRYLETSDTTTVCSWKGVASYYDIVVDGQRNKDAAWYYPDPKEAAYQITGHIAFWHGVEVER